MINLNEMREIWTPNLYFRNAVEVKNLNSFGDSLKNLWFKSDDKMVWYLEEQIVTFLCPMSFERFPNDSHECNWILMSWVEASYKVKLSKPTLHTWNATERISGSKLLLVSDTMDEYAFEFEAMEPDEIIDIHSHQYKNSRVGIKVHIERTDKGRYKIFSSYYATSGVFGGLSVVSFLIDANQVPGRMGLLITLCLVLINSYSSVDAPSNRGFSTLEKWFAGTLTPVFFGIIEFGLVLAHGKFNNPSKSFVKVVDSTSLIITLSYLVAFNVYFWFYGG